MLRRRGSLSSGHVPEAPQQTATAESERKFRILVVDDSAANRKLTMWMLGQLGYVADAAGNGREALEAIERVPFDLVLMDCRMPEMDGYEATRQIRRREGMGRHVKVVAMTAQALPGDERKRFNAGMDDYISKPLNIEGLAAVLDRVLGGQINTACGEALAPSAQTDGDQPEGCAGACTERRDNGVFARAGWTAGWPNRDGSEGSARAVAADFREPRAGGQ